MEILNIDMNNHSLCKGEVREGMNLIAWDSIQVCRPEGCPIGAAGICMYAEDSRDAPCRVQTEYLQSFVAVVFRTYKSLDEADTYRIGMHLVPLYSQLCRMKLVEKSIEQVLYYDKHGNPGVHPIYKEIRDTIKVISNLWKDIGMRAGPPGAGELTPQFGPGKSGFGDPNHYNNISQGTEKKVNVVR